MHVVNQLTEAWKKRKTDLSGQTFFELPKHMEEATKEENRLATWSVPPHEWNERAKKNRFRLRLWQPVVAVIGLVFAWVFLLLLEKMGAVPSGGLRTAAFIGFPLWMMFSNWRQAAKRWPDVNAPQEIVIAKTMAIIRGEPAVWDYSESLFHGVTQTVVRSVSLDKNKPPLITIKTKSQHINPHFQRRRPTIRYNIAIEIPVPANKLAEAEQIVRAIDKHATKEFADV